MAVWAGCCLVARKCDPVSCSSNLFQYKKVPSNRFVIASEQNRNLFGRLIHQGLSNTQQFDYSTTTRYQEIDFPTIIMSKFSVILATYWAANSRMRHYGAIQGLSPCRLSIVVPETKVK